MAGGELERILIDAAARSAEGADPESLTRLLRAAGPEEAASLAASLRRNSILFQVLQVVSESLSLDVILPRLIGLVTEALDADRATLFLLDPETGELFSRVARGDGVTEIRIPSHAGIAGSVFSSGRAEIIADAYADQRFNPDIDRQTGYRTKSVLAVPLHRRAADKPIGVTQVLNKKNGGFTAEDLKLLESISAQAATALDHARIHESLERAHRDETALLEVADMITAELDLDALLARVVTATTRLLDAERSTLFMYDARNHQLWSRVVEGAGITEIRVPPSAGVAGAAFTAGKILNIPDAYADPRFNQEVDRKTGFKTRSILCVPILDRARNPIGVIQVLNKHGGPFGPSDEKRLKAFSSQIGIAMLNAQLFTDVLALKKYNDGILKSLTNGVVTLDQNGKIVKVNDAAERILQLPVLDHGNRPRTAASVLAENNPWIGKSVEFVRQTGGTDFHSDMDFKRQDGESMSVNVTVAPLVGVANEFMGTLLVFEDITREKRMRSTMSRYMAKEVVDRLLSESRDALEGAAVTATVLFSDIRKFTTIAEGQSARATVSMLNDYFTDMVEVVFKHNGMLDKYIGDAIMAVFGAPITTETDADNAVTVANEMLRALRAFNTRRAKQEFEKIDIGIGLATGDVLAGSIGSAKRLDYTVIGDSVNLAARLESANKFYGTDVLVSHATVESLKRQHKLRRIDLIKVKGKNLPTPIYEALDHHDEETFPGIDRVIDLYERALDAYRAREWASAKDQFQNVLALRQSDGPSKVYLDRIQYYLENPPPDDWQGVWALTEK